MDAIRTLLCWNPAIDAQALFWHDAAPTARTISVDELGAACRIAVRPPAGVRMASLLPEDIAYLEHARRPQRLADAVWTVVGDARPWRVISVAAIDEADLFAAASAAFRPDVVAAAAGVELPDGSGPALRRLASPGGTISCEASLLPIVEAWIAGSADRAGRRCGSARRYGVDELVTAGLPPPDPAAALPYARIASGRRASLLLPGRGGGAARLVLHLLAGSARPEAASVRLLWDGIDIAGQWCHDRVVLSLPWVAAATCHRLDIAHDCAGAALALVAVEYGPP